VFALSTSCGGEPFVLTVDASTDDGPFAQPGLDATPDVPIVTTNVVICPGRVCAAELCCTSDTAPNASNCTNGVCGCSTQLGCANEANCAGVMSVCCIDKRTDSTCGSGHFVATCKIGCTGSEQRLCDPNVPRCPGGRTCSTDGSDLANVALPIASGYGVCK
jgi:hypothetical protein